MADPDRARLWTLTVVALALGCAPEPDLHWRVHPDAETVFAPAVDRWHKASGLAMTYELDAGAHPKTPWSVTYSQLSSPPSRVTCGRGSPHYGWLVLLADLEDSPCPDYTVAHELMHVLAATKGHPRSGLGAAGGAGDDVLDEATLAFVCARRRCPWERPE